MHGSRSTAEQQIPIGRAFRCYHPHAEVRVRDLAGGGERAIAAAGTYPFLGPVLNGDGSRIAYTDQPEPGKYVTYVSETAAPPLQVVCEGCVVEAFSDDPPSLLLWILGEDSERLVRRRLQDGQEVPVAAISDADVALSPNGRQLAFTQARGDGAALLYVAPVDNPPSPRNSWKLIAEDRNFLTGPQWSPDGKLLYYFSQGGAFRCVWARRVAPDESPVGAPIAVLHLHPGAGMMGSAMSLGVTKGRLYVLHSGLRGDVYSVQLER